MWHANTAPEPKPNVALVYASGDAPLLEQNLLHILRRSKFDVIEANTPEAFEQMLGWQPDAVVMTFKEGETKQLMSQIRKMDRKPFIALISESVIRSGAQPGNMQFTRNTPQAAKGVLEKADMVFPITDLNDKWDLQLGDDIQRRLSERRKNLLDAVRTTIRTPLDYAEKPSGHHPPGNGRKRQAQLIRQ